MPALLDPPLLAPARLIGRLRFHAAGIGDQLGRRVLIAHAHHRLVWQSKAAQTTLELAFDAARGVMLRRAMFENDMCVHLTEALSARFDVPLEPALFTFQRSVGLA